MTKRVTSHDVAKRAGVSRGVVSAVINGTPGIRVSEEKRREVLKAIEELSYSVDAQARSMRTGKSKCIAAYGNLDNPFFLQVLQGVQRACTERDYHLLLYGHNRQESKQALIKLFNQRRIDGLLTKDVTGYEDEEWIAMVKEAGIPYMSIEGYPDREEVQSVLLDYGASIHLALDYLYAQTGLPPIYVEMYNGPEYAPNWGDRNRRSGYVEWMQLKGLDPVIWQQRDGEIDPSWWDERIRSLPLPSALLTNWSQGGFLIYQSARRLELSIGRDLYVMAADNTMRANEYMVPALSAVEMPYVEMGKAGAHRLLDLIEGKQPRAASKIWMPAVLAPRESTPLVNGRQD
ncbi:LacI family DNA-binding transcriptional regulator [Paenibacillus puerhi]|uniref:LacI family DNA-binding transcriptional regulator n=1 Tax=Paenibacillus puerhi TaxID=2692622 RepID=UPI00135B8102|nr:LacI family DNA-binding transcriptional regulator [Paenibacillus puerhi]